ncbi:MULTISPECIES: antibiotic biosynthesis monooxygenase family protein [unclassified Mycobacterium]|uniref:putative quinol monooxygenase n=1 Tax=unclassified Mycobacterium TaxID=2642494 RepID=UPI00048C9F7E|nr:MULTISPECIES: antibiotic biosynthesis monooxygenase family protein [unclassified Mycobacterium]SEB21770.1 Quinol monooxygenase YgiN [Mycobacterium sp. 283mftsu]
MKILSSPGEPSVVEYIRYRIPPERAEDFVAAYRAATVPLRESAHCLGYELTRCVEEADRWILRIRWTSVADHLEKFRRSTHFRDFFSHIAPFVDQIDEMQHYDVALVG